METNEYISYINEQLYDYNKESIVKIKNIQEKIKYEKINILVCQFQGIGDCILLSSFLRSLRLLNPTANIIFFGYDHNAAIFDTCPYINRAVYISEKDCSYINNANNLFEIKDKLLQIISELLHDGFIYLSFLTTWNEFNQMPNTIIFLAGVKERVAYAENDYQRYLTDKSFPTYVNVDNFYVNHKINVPLNIIHEVDRNVYLLTYYVNKYINSDLECWLNAEDYIAISSDKLKVAVGLGGSLIYKKYPLDKWINIFKAFPNISFYLFEKDYIDIDLPNCINYTGKLSIRQCISVISQCDLYLGHDTCFIHAAAAYKKPCIVLYKESLDKLNYYRKKNYHGYLSFYERWKPYNIEHIALFPKHSIYPCNKKEIVICDCNHNKCISHIPEKEVIDAIKKLGV